VLPFALKSALRRPGLQPDCRITGEQVRSHVLCVTPVTAWKVAKPVSLGKAAFQSIVRLIQEIVTRFRVGVI